MTYALEVKELPAAVPAAGPPASPGPQAAPQGPRPIRDSDVPSWSGDVYQEGDESSPDDAQWTFTGQGGEQAWLDRSEDGTMTGWVRGADGTVFKYSDVDAWAVEVDDAGMERVGGDGPDTGGDALDDGDDVEDPNAADDPTAGDDYTNPDVSPGDAPDAGSTAEDAVLEDYMSGELDGDDPVDEDDEDEDDPRKAREGKVLRIHYRR